MASNTRAVRGAGAGAAQGGAGGRLALEKLVVTSRETSSYSMVSKLLAYFSQRFLHYSLYMII